MMTLWQAAEKHLSLRCALRFSRNDVGLPPACFLAFCEDKGTAVVTADLAHRWAVSTDELPTRVA
jgi:hypothetical protein